MFICKSCKESYSNQTMLGIVCGQVTREILSKNGITQSATGDVIKGFLSGYKIECPKCGEHSWDYE